MEQKGYNSVPALQKMIEDINESKSEFEKIVTDFDNELNSVNVVWNDPAFYKFRNERYSPKIEELKEKLFPQMDRLATFIEETLIPKVQTWSTT